MNRRNRIIPRAILTVLALALSPYFLVLAALVVLLCLPHLVLKAVRRVRFRAALWLHRPVPPDGDPLAGDDLTAFTGIMRGFKQAAAPEPEYDRRPTWGS